MLTWAVAWTCSAAVMRPLAAVTTKPGVVCAAPAPTFGVIRLCRPVLRAASVSTPPSLIGDRLQWLLAAVMCF